MVSRWVACWWSCYRRRTSWCTLEREGDMGWCKRCLIGWWIGSETFLSKLVAKHYDAHDFCERNCYDLVTFQCIELHTWWPFLARLDNTEACGRKAFGAPELKPWLVTKTDGRMAFGVEKNTLWMTCFQSSHCHGSWFILVLLFLSFLLWIFFLLFLDVHWLLLWFWVVVHVVPSVSRTPWPSDFPRSQLLPDVTGSGAQTQLLGVSDATHGGWMNSTQWLPRRKGEKR